MNMLEIMDRESYSKSEVYLYEENGKWFAYDRSATRLSRLNDEKVKLQKRLCSFYGVMLNKVEVDLVQLLDHNWFVALCADNEMMLIKNA